MAGIYLILFEKQLLFSLHFWIYNHQSLLILYMSSDVLNIFYSRCLFQCAVFKVQSEAISWLSVFLEWFSRRFKITFETVAFVCYFKPVGLSGLEPPTSRLSGVRSNRLSYKPSLYVFFTGCPFRLTRYGDKGIRTLDPLLARQVLSQLSYTPIKSGSHLSFHVIHSIFGRLRLNLRVRDGNGCDP